MAKTASKQIIEISAEIKIETPKAWLLCDGITSKWVPRQLVRADQEKKIFTMPEWLAYKKGFI